MVKSVDPTMSIAIVWAHPDFRVSAMAVDGGAFGIVGAHLGGEPERYLLEMRGVPMRSTLKPGTLIVSSGLGGTFPRGIPVGTVIAEMKTSELWARTYLLRPGRRAGRRVGCDGAAPRAHDRWRADGVEDRAARRFGRQEHRRRRRLSRAACRQARFGCGASRHHCRGATARAVTAPPVVPSPQREARPAKAPPPPRTRRRRPLHETDGFLSHADRVHHSGDAALHLAPLAWMACRA